MDSLTAAPFARKTAVQGTVTQPNGSAAVWFWLGALPVLVYFASIGFLSINAPQNDDFQSILHDIIAFDNAPDRLQWLVAQYVEHRIAYVRLMVLTWQRLTGTINFTALNFLGNFSLLGVLWLLAQWFWRQRLLPYFLPIPFILLIPNYHHNIFVSMMALQNLSVLFWAALTIWWVADGRQWRPWAALVPALLCLYTSGNGLLLLPLALMLFVWQRRWRLVIGWSVVALAAMLAYCWQLTPMQANHKLSFLLPHLPHVGAFIVFFLGCYADLLPNVLQRASAGSDSLLVRGVFYLRLLVSFGVGLFLLGNALLICWRWWLSRSSVLRPVRWFAKNGPINYTTPTNTFIAGMLLFVLLTAVMVAVGRIHGGIAQSFSIRYKVYSPLLAGLIYAFWVANLATSAQRQRLFRVAVVGSMLVWLNSYGQHLSQIQHSRHVTIAGMFNWHTNGTWAVYGSTYGDIDTVLRQAEQRRLYVPDTALLRPLTYLTTALRQPQPVIPASVDSTEHGWSLRADQTPLALPFLSRSPADGGYFVLHNDRHTYLIPALVNRDTFGRQTAGLWAFVEQTTHGLTPGTYQLAILTVQRGQSQLRHTKQQLRLR